MSLFTVDLGEMAFSSSASDLHLVLRSSTQISSPRPLDDDSLSTLEYRRLLLSRDYWLTRGGGFHLSLRLLIDGRRTTDTCLHQILIQNLYESFVTAELWGQLHLRPVRSIIAIDNLAFRSYQHDIHIPLYFADRSRESDETLSSQDTPCFGHVRPPKDVPVLAMHQLYLELDISQKPSSQVTRNGKKQRMNSVSYDLTNISHHFVPDYQNQRNLALQCKLPSLPESGKEAKSVVVPDCAALQRRRDAKQPTMKRQSEDLRLAFQSNSLPVVQSSNVRDVLELTDIAFRTLIGAPTLEDLTPSLWCPGFLADISGREPFLLTISRAMSSVAQRTKSEALKVACDALYSSHHPETSVSKVILLQGVRATSTESSHPEICQQTATGVRLWKLLQKQLYHPNAARTLKHLQNQPSTPLSAQADGMEVDQPTSESTGSQNPPPDGIHLEEPRRRLKVTREPTSITPIEHRSSLARIKAALDPALPTHPHVPLESGQGAVSTCARLDGDETPEVATCASSDASTEFESDWWPSDTEEQSTDIRSDGDGDRDTWFSDEGVKASSSSTAICHHNLGKALMDKQCEEWRQSPVIPLRRLSSAWEDSRPDSRSCCIGTSPPWHEMALLIDGASPLTMTSGLSTPPPVWSSSPLFTPESSFASSHDQSLPTSTETMQLRPAFTRHSTPLLDSESAVSQPSSPLFDLSTPPVATKLIRFPTPASPSPVSAFSNPSYIIDSPPYFARPLITAPDSTSSALSTLPALTEFDFFFTNL